MYRRCVPKQVDINVKKFQVPTIIIFFNYKLPNNKLLFFDETFVYPISSTFQLKCF